MVVQVGTRTWSVASIPGVIGPAPSRFLGVDGRIIPGLAVAAVRRCKAAREHADDARGRDWWAEYQASKAQERAKTAAAERSGSPAHSSEMQAGREQGWYRDHYGLHEARWYSMGQPTALVLDHGREGQDPPPQGVPAQAPEPLPGIANATDRRRAGVSEANRVAPASEDDTDSEKPGIATVQRGSLPVRLPRRFGLS